VISEIMKQNGRHLPLLRCSTWKLFLYIDSLNDNQRETNSLADFRGQGIEIDDAGIDKMNNIKDSRRGS
jgi:hypothetical protein